MEQSIASLSPEQAQRALLIFFDILPGDIWEEGGKPSASKLESAAERVQEEATDEVRPVVEAMLAEGNEGVKGEAAKAVLNEFYEREELRGYVEQAAQQAQQPHMSPIPLIIGAVIVLLAAIPKDVDFKQKRWKLGHLRDAAALVKALAEFAGKLPAEVWKGFMKGDK
jgi:hypothetical protein